MRNDAAFFIGGGESDCTLPCELTAKDKIASLDEEELGITHAFFVGGGLSENTAPPVVEAKPNQLIVLGQRDRA
ncbi:hypothetical protein GCM10011329_00430 [Stakelama pacifica]|nr:hypothetical protein GCM10011329_00430 [Stakelama pacifica]